MDALVKKLEADLARDFAASKAVETRLDERNLELKAEKRRSESLQAALDAVQKVEPTGDDETDKLSGVVTAGRGVGTGARNGQKRRRGDPRRTRPSRRDGARPPRRRRRN